MEGSGRSIVRVGVLMRSFARTSDKVEATVERVMNALKGVAWYSDAGAWFVGNVLVLVPTDKRYKDCDCGELAAKIRLAWKLHKEEIDGGGHAPLPRAEVTVIELALGDVFVDTQNFAINFFSSKGCGAMITMAPSAARYFDEGTAKAAMNSIIADGAKVFGIKVPEDGIDDFVQRGTLGGPIAGWDLDALVEAGGFDESARQAKVGEEKLNGGAEEIHPLVRIIEKYGPCMAPINPIGEPVEKRNLEGEELVRHLKQIASKTDRQLAHASSFGRGYGLEFFARGVLKKYR